MKMRVLLVEDSLPDQMLTSRALQKAMAARGWEYDLDVVFDGRQALDRLFAGSKLKSPGYHMVLLDLWLPVLDGHETLKAIREHPQGYKVPVVVLTTSDNPTDVEQAWRTSVQAYVVKPGSNNGGKFDHVLDWVSAVFLGLNVRAA